MPRLRVLLLFFGDLLISWGSFLFASFLLLDGGFVPDLNFDLYIWVENGLLKIGILIVTLLFGFYFFGLYEKLLIRSKRQLAEDLIFIFGGAFLVQAFVAYLYPMLMMSRWIMLIGTLFAFVGLIVWHSMYSVMLIRIFGRQRVIFIGDSNIARVTADHIGRHPEKGFEVIGCLSPESATVEKFPSGNLMEPMPDLSAQIRQLQPDRISVACEFSTQSAIAASLLWCSMNRIRVESISELYENLFQRVSLETISMNQLIFSPSLRPPAYMEVLQRIYGVFFSILGILVTWPLMVLTAIAVRLDSPGAALLRQERVGLNGEHFHILKFRSMFVDADRRFGRTRADKEDPRITRVGRFIRVARLDELPQFFNVLRGEMNFVGPRPEMPIYVKELTQAIPLYPQRLRVKPGITGWAQLHHTPELTTAETAVKLAYDLYYIKNMSPLLDFLILFHTFKAVLFRTGAR